MDESAATMLTSGSGTPVMLTDATPGQPSAEVPVTVMIPEGGIRVLISAADRPLLHEYVTAPDALRDKEAPTQAIVGEATALISGVFFTDTASVAVDVHPFVPVPVTARTKLTGSGGVNVKT